MPEADARSRSLRRLRVLARATAAPVTPARPHPTQLPAAGLGRRLATGPAPPGEGFATMDLSGRVALVTGGGQGLGGTICLAL